jgi:hypothetical protein
MMYSALPAVHQKNVSAWSHLQASRLVKPARRNSNDLMIYSKLARSINLHHTRQYKAEKQAVMLKGRCSSRAGVFGVAESPLFNRQNCRPFKQFCCEPHLLLSSNFQGLSPGFSSVICCLTKGA